MEWRSRHRAMVAPYKETKQQQKERIVEYLDSGAQPICKKCDKILRHPSCDCSPDIDDASIGFAWPSVYSKKQKIINLMRWVYKVGHTDSKIKGRRDMIRKSKKKERRQESARYNMQGQGLFEKGYVYSLWHTGGGSL